MQKNKQKPILCLIAGSSGGHIIPALVLAEKWFKENPSGEVIFFGSNKAIDKVIITSFKFLKKKHCLNLINFPGKKFWLIPIFLFQFSVVFIRFFICFARLRPKSILSTGGYLAIPACIAAKFFRIPIELYELNVLPGRAANFLFPFVDKIFITFEKCKGYLKDKAAKKCFLSSYPLRFNESDKVFDKSKLITFINQKLKSLLKCSNIKTITKLGCENLETEAFVPFDLKRKTIFILGGSQGAIFINSLFKKWITSYPEAHQSLQVIHQVGINDKTDWSSFYLNLKIPAFTFSFYNDLKNFYLLADLVICRAGAGTLFELEFFKKKSLIIPHKLDLATHQLLNAKEMVTKNPHLFTLHEQSSLNPNVSFFNEKIKETIFY